MVICCLIRLITTGVAHLYDHNLYFVLDREEEVEGRGEEEEEGERIGGGRGREICGGGWEREAVPGVSCLPA